MYTSKYKRNENLLSADDTLLLVIDVQEKFRPVLSEMDGVVQNIRILLESASRLKIPTLFTEQYPKGLGPTVAELSEYQREHQSEHHSEGEIEGQRVKGETFPKLSFSAIAVKDIYEKLKTTKKRQIVVVGVESHVCVMQTVMDLAANFDGWIYCVSDAVTSRNPEDRKIALDRMQENGARLITTEMAVFEWLKEAGSENFKALQKLIIAKRG